MTLLHPWALAIGGAAVATPLLIHWLTKPRPTSMPLSTVRFLKQVVQQKRARYRLRDLLVLLLRIAAVAAVAWAFARPLTGGQPLIAADQAGDAIRVVLLDASQSTAAVSNGTTAFERGRAAAAGYLKYQSGLRASLIVAGAKPKEVFDQPSFNLAALRDTLADAQVLTQRLDVQAAINAAAKDLASAPANRAPRRELVIISDFQRANWASADFSALPKDTKIQFESTAPSQTPANLAILGVAPSGRLEQGHEAQLQIEIGNFSAQARNVQVDLTINDTPYHVAGLCPPGVKTTLTTSVPLPTAGWIEGRATLAGNSDALAADDSRPFVLGVRASPSYMLLTRETGRPRAASSYFVERALAPKSASLDTAGAAERVVRVDPQQPDKDAITSADLLVIDHPGKLPGDLIGTLANLMRRGRGVLYIAAESIDATNLKLLAEAAGADLKMPVEFLPPPADAERRDLFLVDWKNDQPPFAGLGESANVLLSPLRFAGGLGSRQISGGLSDDIVATYSDRSAAVVVTACGAGSLAVVNADLSQSSLPSSPAFVPVIGELAGRLIASRSAAGASASGEVLSVALPPEAGAAEGLVVIPQQQTSNLGTLADSGGMVMWRWDEAGAPGVYRVKRGNDIVFALAIAAPPQEADLEALDPAVLQKRLVGAYATEFRSAGQQPPRDDAWAWLLTICAACMIGEVLLLKAYRT